MKYQILKARWKRFWYLNWRLFRLTFLLIFNRSKLKDWKSECAYSLFDGTGRLLVIGTCESNFQQVKIFWAHPDYLATQHLVKNVMEW